MLDPNKIKAQILEDVKTELTDEFDRNFQRKGFFSSPWKPRAHEYPRGSLLLVTGAMRRSIKSEVSGDGVRFTSSMPYTAIHNEGGTGFKPVKAHMRRSKKGKTYNVRAHQRRFTMPKRQFIGDGPDTQRIIRDVIDDNLKQYNLTLKNFIKK